MLQLESIDELRSAVRDWSEAGERVALVPTMGNLHRGHISLVEHARKLADHVVVSVFVNPTQFGVGEDFEDYPRTLDMDSLLLKRAKADVLFIPEVSDVYPFGKQASVKISVPELSDEFCGASRPGHFDGVAGVVCRLFNMVRPDVAVFGRKDYQQLLIIRRLASDLSIPVRIEGAPTVRENDGLAMSSRNQYLDEEERAIAPRLRECLLNLREQVLSGASDFSALERDARKQLDEAGFATDYIAIRSAASLAQAQHGEHLVILAAAQLGKARLIDNLEIEPEAEPDD